jgi:hypothetical protein
VDRRIRFLIKRLDNAEVVDPAARLGAEDEDRVYFGATVDIVNGRGEPRTVSIVGVDEIDTARGYISWVSPMARALIKAREGDSVTLQTPGGSEELEIARALPLATGDAAGQPMTDARCGLRRARLSIWNVSSNHGSRSRPARTKARHADCAYARAARCQRVAAARPGRGDRA